MHGATPRRRSPAQPGPQRSCVAFFLSLFFFFVSLTYLCRASVAAVEASIATVRRVAFEAADRASILLAVGELDATLRENGGATPRTAPSVRECINSVTEVCTTADQTLAQLLASLESASRVDDSVSLYRLRAEHFVQWCAAQRVAVDVRAEGTAGAAAQQQALAAFERERATQQQRLSDLEAAWLELETSPGRTCAC
jgi:hypothetical protein